MQITDGYTSTYVSTGLEFIFRPVLQPERAHVLREASRKGRWAESAYQTAVRHHVLKFLCGDMTDVLHDPDALIEVVGVGRTLEEREDVENLYWGTILELRYPHLSKVSCNTCALFQFDPLTGYFSRRGGERVARPPGDSLLCQTREGCPKGSPQEPRTLSPKNRCALEYDLDCRAIGCWPDDPIVRRNARVIGHALREARRGP